MIIRKAQDTKKDCDLVFALSNDPVVRACSFNTNAIEYENHCKWYKKRLEDKNTLFFLIFDEEHFVGQIRFNRESELSTDCVISLSIAKEYRGKHVSSEFIQLGILELKNQWISIITVVAEVKGENIASNRLFEREGFNLISTINTYKLTVQNK